MAIRYEPINRKKFRFLSAGEMFKGVDYISNWGLEEDEDFGSEAFHLRFAYVGRFMNTEVFREKRWEILSGEHRLLFVCLVHLCPNGTFQYLPGDWNGVDFDGWQDEANKRPALAAEFVNFLREKIPPKVLPPGRSVIHDFYPCESDPDSSTLWVDTSPWATRPRS